MHQGYDLKYLQLLSKQYPTIDEVTTEVINLSAIINLPKGTEHFLTDIHGEHEAFDRVMRNASGVVKRKIGDTFGDLLTAEEKKSLATLVYYPKEKLDMIKSSDIEMKEWYRTTIYRLVLLSRAAGYKYTRSKVRKALPQSFAYIIEELLNEKENSEMKQTYYQSIINSIIDIDCADDFIIAMCQVIRKLVVDRLHIIGDIYDRGPGAHIIMDLLIGHHSVDVQWGNHDILWMGAAAGSESCIANTIRIALRYGNLETLEEGYGINLSALIRFTLETYKGAYSSKVRAKVKPTEFKEKDIDLLSRMQKAIAVIQFKVEGQLIERRPEFHMADRNIMETMNLEKGTVLVDGLEYKLNDTDFPTFDPQNPYKLTDEEREVLDKLKQSFMRSEKLKEHIEFLYNKGSMYLVHNQNLMYHGCIPIDDKGEFLAFNAHGYKYSGKALLDYFDHMARKAYFSHKAEEKAEALDTMWYMWCGELSPLFGKKKMATFERYFIDDKKTHKEIKNPYYELRSDEGVCTNVLKEFGLEKSFSHIISGHVPVKAADGEVPIKAGGKLIAIDGGFSKAYQKETGIAGYTLIFNSQGMVLVSHERFESKARSIEEDLDVLPTTVFIEKDQPRMYVGDTDVGREMKENIRALKALLSAYREGEICQKGHTIQF
ncbi:fructose-1,6-bisphosphatase [Fusibacter sp. JL216-2]|uniref:fructose-1,6-bisphosphatase n=1 Tax=Fusibacter sp. JL216-2 TaxID=3071453 RepID=UPI003D359216